jgi:hypothetical protein
MPYTFGATTDDISWPITPSVAATDRGSLIAGWWLPTTLTATRTLWSGGSGGVPRAEIDSTTSELRLRTNNTTDGQWTTTGVGLATDQWKFLAFLLTTNNTNGASWNVWAGTSETPPSQVTVTVAVARSGNFTGATSFYVGNAGTGSLAFQGDAALVWTMLTSAAVGAIHPLGLTTAYGSARTTAETDWVEQNLVIPMWRGDLRIDSMVGRKNAVEFYVNYWRGCALDLIHDNSSGMSASASVTPQQTVGIQGATISQNGAPRPLDSIFLPRSRR